MTDPTNPAQDPPPSDPASSDPAPSDPAPSDPASADAGAGDPRLLDPVALQEELLEDPSRADREITAEQVSIGRRLRQPRTIISIAVPIGIIVFFLFINGGRLSAVPALILQANPALVLAAFVVFYLGFPFRGFRWARLLRATGFRIGVPDSTEILYLSWFVNCVVPAKLGDVYRAYLLKMNSPASLSRTFGTVFIERILDLFAIALLGLAAGFFSFRTGMPPAVRLVFIVGIVVVVVLAVGLFTMRNFGRRIIVRLPLPARIRELYERFEEGVFGGVGLRQLPILATVTADHLARPRGSASGWSSRRSASRTWSWGCRAPSSWPSSARSSRRSRSARPVSASPRRASSGS